ncbi:MAG: zinc metallopeptidase [Clostridia bacterium]|nr:zinc metallopeptidase [Clostridia bacterium]
MYWDYWIVLGITLLLSLSASAYVKSSYAKYDKVMTSRGVTSNDFVRRMFFDNDITDVTVAHVAGNLTDNYNNSSKTLSLSDSTDGKATVAAVGVAAHEAGHAIQYKKDYFPVRLRSGMAGIVNIGSYLGIILAVIGSLFAGELGETLIQIGLLLYSTVFLFTVVTLPVEINASRRAISAVRSSGYFTEEETAGMKKVLTAAALTYVAAMASALLNLLRMIYIFGGRRRS